MSKSITIVYGARPVVRLMRWTDDMLGALAQPDAGDEINYLDTLMWMAVVAFGPRFKRN